MNKPDLHGRRQILEVHTRKTPLSGAVDLDRIARGTPGFTGADLENLVNEAALQAARDNKLKIEQDDFEKAKDKVLMGSERKSMVISENDRRITAYHEAGHALVGKVVPGLDPIHKVTIIPRGMALGLTQTLPEEEQLSLSKKKAQSMIAFLFGGRAAEELVFNDSTTGAGNDIERATELARRMVCEWGMSERLGPLALERREGPVFLGMQSSQSRDYSDSKAEEIDKEVYRIVMEGYELAKKVLKDNMAALHKMAEVLLEHETIDAEEVAILVKGGGLQEIGDRRGDRQIVLAKERKQAAEEDAKKTKEEEERLRAKESGERDPVGSSGPVTA